MQQGFVAGVVAKVLDAFIEFGKPNAISFEITRNLFASSIES